MRADLHAHTTYSDGSALPAMCRAAERAGLDAVGFTDHCIAVDDALGRRDRYDLVETHERRREAIERMRPRTGLTVWDAAEVSYVADAEAETVALLDEAGFDYAIGSVHFAGPYDYTSGAQYVGATDAERRAAVERYYDAVVAAVESGLFDVLGHLDLPERTDALRGYARRADYERVAAALADAETVPEINAGRVHESLGRVHPDPELLDVFLGRDIRFVLGSDSHTPREIGRRVPVLQTVADRHDVEPIPAERVVGEPASATR